MRKAIPFLVLFGLAGCDLSHEPEFRSQPNQLELQGQWSATIAGVGSTTLSGTLSVREFGSYSETELSISAAPASGYQWRIFRGSCAATAAAQLGLHSTSGAYPDLVTNGSGSAAVSPLLGGSLNSPAGVYSVRFRMATTTTNWNGTSPVACGNLQRS